MEKAKTSEENKKMRYRCGKSEKNEPTWANLPPQDEKPEKIIVPDGMANPHSLLHKERNPSVTFRKPIQVSLTNLNH